VASGSRMAKKCDLSKVFFNHRHTLQCNGGPRICDATPPIHQRSSNKVTWCRDRARRREDWETPIDTTCVEEHLFELIFNSHRITNNSSMANASYTGVDPQDMPIVVDPIMEKALQATFEDLDRGKRGHVGLEELKHACEVEGLIVSDKNLKRFIQRIDTNRSGMIELSELKEHFPRLKRASLRSIFEAYQDQYDASFHIDITPHPPHADLKYFIAGAFAGGLSRTFTAPMDRIRVLLQGTESTGKGMFEEIGHALRVILRDSGVRGLWTGNLVNIAKIAPESGINFLTFEHIKKYVAAKEGKDSVGDISGWGRFVAGGIAGLVSMFFIYPADTVRARVMSNLDIRDSTKSVAQKSVTPSYSLSQVIRDMYKTEGIRSFYHGLIPCLVGIIPYSGINLWAFDSLKYWYIRKNYRDPSVPILLTMGSFAAVRICLVFLKRD
jgi:solute carrier family 25 phosphate transporter 23/24/25/41